MTTLLRSRTLRETHPNHETPHEMRLDVDFPGGNAIIERVDGQDVYLRPDLRDTAGHWFYWCVRMRGGAGRTWRFHLTSENTLAARGPAVSLDGGWTWRWLGDAPVDGPWSFQFECPAEAHDVRLAMTMAYTRAHWERFVARHRGHPRLEVGELCRSRQGRVVDRVLIGTRGHEPRHRVFLTARHHSCETMGSYLLEGLLDAVLSDDDLGKWFGESVEILAVPFVDADGVEAGDQGKNRTPRDHNRDYDGESIHAETAAIRAEAPKWAREKLDIALDLHCPGIRGERNEVIYLVGARDPQVWREQVRLGEALEACRTGPLPYAASDDLPYGQEWNVDRNYGQGMSCARWAKEVAGATLSSSIEIPYAVARGAEVNADTARAFGRDLAGAIRAYLSAPG